MQLDPEGLRGGGSTAALRAQRRTRYARTMADTPQKLDVQQLLAPTSFLGALAVFVVGSLLVKAITRR